MTENVPVAPPNITIENAKFVYRPNFSGREEMYNEEGNRYFNVEIPENILETVQGDGWPVKFTKPRKNSSPEEIESFVPRPYLEVSVGFKYRPPLVILIADGKQTTLSDETVGMVDDTEFENIDVVLRGRYWEGLGTTGIKPYLQTFYGTVRMDDLRRKYANL